ncbi:MAG: succinate dehydrogenase, cytochrome b556 subunit [Paracoccaceae bacterium]
MSKHMQNRPLSPHLTIYRPQLNSVLSILHRITGIALSITLLIIIGFFISLIFGEEVFIVFSNYFNSIVGKLIMFFFTLWYLVSFFCWG